MQAVDRSKCRKCGLGEPQVTIPLIRGIPRGECLRCRNNREQAKRNKSRLFKDFYSFSRPLVALNYRTLRGALPGAYSLRHSLKQVELGYVVVGLRTVLIALDGQRSVYRIDLFGLAQFLSNQNIEIDPKPIQIADIDTLGDGLPVLDVTDKLVIYDLKLREYAVAKVKAELEDAKRKSRNLPRSKNPSSNPSPKPSE